MKHQEIIHPWWHEKSTTTHMNPTDHHHKPSSSTNSQTLNPIYDSYPLIHQLQTEISDHDTQFIL
jgi:hypothetical protein